MPYTITLEDLYWQPRGIITDAPAPLDDLRNGELGLTTVRPAPRTDAWYAAQADEYFRTEAVEHPGMRAKFIADLKMIDRAYCNNARTA